MAPTTLAEAITAVPQLRSSCILVLTCPQDASGTGIKLLRLVSKQLCNAMLGAVRGYTLTLDGSRMIDKIALLQGVQLSCLRVVVTAANNSGGLVVGKVCGKGLILYKFIP